MSEQKFRVESDLLGELQVPADAYYGVQTQRALNNYKISTTKMLHYPEYINSIAYVKMAAAAANTELGVLDPMIGNAIVEACKEIVAGKFHDQFPVDMMQGGAGTSVNMNANEVIANRALELLGHKKGEYQYCSPNDHVNCAQSTNDAYPTAFRYTFFRMNRILIQSLENLIASFRAKGEEFKDIIKMGRTQLQDAVPMTSGQEFNAFANNLEEEIANLNRNAVLLKEINMGGTAIGTGLNAVPGFAELCTRKLS
ncbi:MAG: aspartate ammonia-lyase, partial [Bacteroidales bacterium]|nr:aspartate ammonia-lyase [Bacteroidales bacterium]